MERSRSHPPANYEDTSWVEEFFSGCLASQFRSSSFSRSSFIIDERKLGQEGVACSTPAWTVRFADLPQIEGTAGRFMLKQMAVVAELGPALSPIASTLRSPPPVARSWAGFRAGAKLTAKARQKGAGPMQRPQLAATRANGRRSAGERRCLAWAIASALSSDWPCRIENQIT
jgi:hypothetical protein